jgi:hypothetical protein
MRVTACEIPLTFFSNSNLGDLDDFKTIRFGQISYWPY